MTASKYIKAYIIDRNGLCSVHVDPDDLEIPLDDPRIKNPDTARLMCKRARIVLTGCELSPLAVYLTPERAWYSASRPDDYSGVWKEYTNDGTLVDQASYTDGKLDGYARLFNPDTGLRTYEAFHINGKRCGPVTTWYRSGNKATVDHYDDDVKSGESVEYFDKPEGVIMLRVMYKGGQKHGDYYSISEDGTSETGRYCGGNKVDKWITCNKSGYILTEGSYVGDTKNGEWLTYFEDSGTLKTQEHYTCDTLTRVVSYIKTGNRSLYYQCHNGERDGEYIAYWPDGTKKVIGCYKNDHRCGTWTRIYSNGVHKVVETYNDIGQRHGVRRKYREDRTQWKYVEYTNGHKNGSYVTFWKNGKVADCGAYVLGMMHGFHVRKDYNGRVVESSLWAAGTKLRETQYHADGSKTVTEYP